MAVWSSLVVRKLSNLNFSKAATVFLRNNFKLQAVSEVPVRHCHDRSLLIKPSTYVYTKFKDLLHFYFVIGAIPFLSIITYVNLFIGPAELALIPEGYEPEPHEYYRHPITRFMAKYFTRSPQERHERNCHNIFYKQEYLSVKALKKKIVDLIREREDYQSWYYEKGTAVKYTRKLSEDMEKIRANQNTNSGWIN